MTIKHDHLYDIGLVLVGVALFILFLLLLYALCRYYDRKVPTLDNVAQNVLPDRIQSYYFLGEAQKLQDDFLMPPRELLISPGEKLYETQVEKIPLTKSVQNLLEIHCEECEKLLEEKTKRLREEYGDELSINEETGEKNCSRSTVV